MNERRRETVRTIGELARQKDISFLAGGIAFFAFVSLIPAMVLVLAVGSVVGGEQFATRVVALVESYLSEEGSQLLTEALEDSRGLASISAVSGLVMFWSTLKVFRAVDVAFGRVYQRRSSSSLLQQLRDGTIVLLATATGVGLLLAVQVVLARFAVVTSIGLLGWPAVVAGLVVVLLPVYYLFPPVRQPLRSVLPGTAVAVVGLLVLQQLFQVYATLAGQYQAYGLVGAVLLFLLWLYFGALIVIFGAIVNAAIAETSAEIARAGEPGQDESSSKTIE